MAEPNDIEIPDKFFLSGIGTSVGKTYVAAYLCNILKYDYWKPIQSGDIEDSDSLFVGRHTEGVKIWPETYKFQLPQSPHAAAAQENTSILLEKFILPDSEKLLVEGAGGLMVPLNNELTMLDLCKHLHLGVILVVRDYLGCINHTLMSVEVLEKHDIPCYCIVFNGNFIESTVTYLSEKLNHLPQLFLVENALEK